MDNFNKLFFVFFFSILGFFFVRDILWITKWKNQEKEKKKLRQGFEEKLKKFNKDNNQEN